MALWDMVPVPENVLGIPKVVYQTIEFDVSMLSPDELLGIKRRKLLEKACSYPAKELHSRAVRAEPEISSLVHHLCCKHGPNRSMIQKDQKRPLRAHLTIQRHIVNTLVHEIDCAHDHADGHGHSEAGSHSPDSPDSPDSPPDLGEPARLEPKRLERGLPTAPAPRVPTRVPEEEV